MVPTVYLIHRSCQESRVQVRHLMCNLPVSSTVVFLCGFMVQLLTCYIPFKSSSHLLLLCRSHMKWIKLDRFHQVLIDNCAECMKKDPNLKFLICTVAWNVFSTLLQSSCLLFGNFEWDIIIVDLFFYNFIYLFFLLHIFIILTWKLGLRVEKWQHVEIDKSWLLLLHTTPVG